MQQQQERDDEMREMALRLRRRYIFHYNISQNANLHLQNRSAKLMKCNHFADNVSYDTNMVRLTLIMTAILMIPLPTIAEPPPYHESNTAMFAKIHTDHGHGRAPSNRSSDASAAATAPMIEVDAAATILEAVDGPHRKVVDDEAIPEADR